MRIRLIEIREDGTIADDVPLSDIARTVCESTLGVYRQNGFHRPWIGYLAVEGGQVLGTCAFKSPPQNARVEIAYFSFPDHEGRGVASQMARQLIELARSADGSIGIVAQTLPEENASTTILRKFGFSHTATVQHPDDGEVWEWSLNS